MVKQYYKKKKGILSKTENILLKGRLLHIKRAPFTMQKGIFYNAKDALLKIN